jgi:hypothetical protein
MLCAVYYQGLLDVNASIVTRWTSASIRKSGCIVLLGRHSLESLEQDLYLFPYGGSFL